MYGAHRGVPGYIPGMSVSAYVDMLFTPMMDYEEAEATPAEVYYEYPPDEAVSRYVDQILEPSVYEEDTAMDLSVAPPAQIGATHAQYGYLAEPDENVAPQGQPGRANGGRYDLRPGRRTVVPVSNRLKRVRRNMRRSRALDF